jgi:hypothetical protein
VEGAEMTNYDTMSVHEIVNILEHEAVNGTGEKDAWAHRTQLILALRRAVIREASVGMCNFYLAEDESGCLVPMYYTFDTAGKNFEADGVYYLIPKEG